MRNSLTSLVTAAAVLGASTAQARPEAGDAAPGVDTAERFFLFVSPQPPLGGLVENAWQGAQGFLPTISADAARRRLGAAFPRLFQAAQSASLEAFEADLKAGVDAHYENALPAAEKTLQAAMGFAFAEPDALTAAPQKLLTRLADASVIRYRNALRMKVEKAKALAELERFIRRFPSLAITTDDHPPEIVAEWRKAHDKVLADASSLTFSVHPVELEREGCDLLVNGVTTGRLAGAPIALPRGEHLIQARCGASGSWLQRLYVDGRPASVTIPVRAMVAARGNPETGGLILVAPQEGDAAALVTAVSQATGLDGAAVVTLNKDRVELGHQEPGLGDPTHGAWARLKGSGIEGWKPAAGPAPAKSSPEGASKSGGGSSFGPWPWVVGGVGLAGVVTGVALNMAYVNEHDAGNTESLSSLQTGSLAGYIGGGALLAAGVVLFLLDDAAPAAAGTSAAGPSSGSAPGSSGPSSGSAPGSSGPTVRAAPGGFAVRF